MGSFNCAKCGLCCTGAREAIKNADMTAEPYRSLLKQFPHPVKEDGSCSKFENGLCTVYENRPLLCNIDAMYDKFYSLKMKRSEYHKLQEKSCTILQNIDDTSRNTTSINT